MNGTTGFQISIFLVLAFSLVSFACAQENTSAESIRIEVGDIPARPGQYRWLKEEIENFDSLHPEYDVKVISLGHPSRRDVPIDKLPSLAANVIGIDSTNGSEAKFLADNGLIVSIDNFLPDTELSMNVFPETIFREVEYDGKIWGVPWFSSAEVLLCDWELFKEIGVSEPPRDWNEFINVARRLTKDTDGDGKIDQWGVRFQTRQWMMTYLPITMVHQLGGSFFEGDKVNLLTPEIEKIFRYFAEILRDSTIGTFDERGLDEIKRDKSVRYAMDILPTHLLSPVLRDKSMRIAKLPTWGSDEVACRRRGFLAIRKSTPEQEAASWELIKWISRRDVSMPGFWGGYPNRLDFVERDDFKAIASKRIQGFEILYTEPIRAVAIQGPVANRLDVISYALSGLRVIDLSDAEVDNYEAIARKVMRESNAIVKTYSSRTNSYDRF